MTSPLEPVDKPIVVNPNPAADQIWVAVRDILKVAGGVLVARGALDAAELEMAIGAIMIIAPMVWAQLRTRRVTSRLAVLAESAPDAVGQVQR